MVRFVEGQRYRYHVYTSAESGEGSSIGPVMTEVSERFITIQVTSLPESPQFQVSGQVTPRPEFVDTVIGYLFDREDETWEVVKDVKAAAAA